MHGSVVEGAPLPCGVPVEVWQQSHHVLYRVQFLSSGAVGAASAACLDFGCEGPGASGALAAGSVCELRWHKVHV